MRLIILLVMTSLINTSVCKLDISDIVEKSNRIAVSYFKKDAMGNDYHPKPWQVYYKFVNKNSLANILFNKSGKNDKLLSADSYRFKLNSKKGKIRDSNQLKANLDFNYIEIQIPQPSNLKNRYSTILWIRDKSWTSGFCILVDFKIVNGVCKFIKGTPLVISDIQESY